MQCIGFLRKSALPPFEHEGWLPARELFVRVLTLYNAIFGFHQVSVQKGNIIQNASLVFFFCQQLFINGKLDHWILMIGSEISYGESPEDWK